MVHPYILHNDDIRAAEEPAIAPGQVGALSGWGVFSTLSVAHVAPSMSPGGSIKYRTGDPAVAIGGGLSIADPDSGGTLTGATVQITGGTFAGDGDVYFRSFRDVPRNRSAASEHFVIGVGRDHEQTRVAGDGQRG